MERERGVRQPMPTGRKVGLWLAGGLVASVLVGIATTDDEDKAPPPTAPGSARPKAAYDSAGGPYVAVLGTKMEIGPAPLGVPAEVLKATVDANDQACGRVIAALRRADGSIVGRCSSGDRYMVSEVKGAGPIALNCTAAKQILNVDAC